MINIIIIPLICCLYFYAIFSLIEWKLNPAKWENPVRMFAVFTASALILSLIVLLIKINP